MIRTWAGATGLPTRVTQWIEFMNHHLRVQRAAIFVCLAGLLSLSACSKKEMPVAAPPEKPAGGISIDSQPEAPPPPPTVATPTSAGDAAASPTPDAVPPDRGAVSAKEQELLDGVFDAYRNFYADKLRYARDMDELVKGGYLKKAPLPPPGKKIVLDSKNFNVYLAPQ
jgi:hypothetical protein